MAVNECFCVYQIKEDMSSPILKMIENDPKSAVSTKAVSNWLQNCLENHDSCNRFPESQNKPKRLIYVGDESRDPFLVDAENINKRIKWLSLSYCWGGEPLVKLTKNTMNMLRSGVPLAEFDHTIRDAIIVTRALGIPYIWIDSLCIIQDSGGADWNEQASKMNEIYGESTVTLVAASSDTVQKGFLKERPSRYVPISSFNISKTEGTDTDSSLKVYVSSEWDKTEDSADGPWSSRGWTMQEGLLPNRLLYYTSSQAIWKCCKEERFERGVVESIEDIMTLSHRFADDMGVASEWLWELEIFTKFKNFKDYLTRYPSKSLLLEPDVFRLWYDLIENYSPREFKDIGDRLVALSGLAKVFGDTIGCDEYVVGLWKPDLIRGLMWNIDGARLVPRSSSIRMRTVNSAIPSWSWACVGYEHVEFRQKSDSRFQALSRVEEIRVDLVDQCQPFGKRGNLQAIRCQN
ncbi:hypothetical protein TruAng_001742 [Truncatella angustata]|nr:hypothetical protein TruAng_001742 [Truncatella angustata]